MSCGVCAIIPEICSTPSGALTLRISSLFCLANEVRCHSRADLRRADRGRKRVDVLPAVCRYNGGILCFP
jgi:hypothetical protein